MTTAAKRPRDRRASIVDAAATLFADRGFAAVGIDDIGAAVGVSGPAIYRHFRGKDAVLAEVVAATATRIADGVDAAARARRTDAARPADGSTGPTGRAVDGLVRHAVAHALDGPAGLATYLRERHRLVDPPAAVLEAERRIRTAWRAGLRAIHPDIDVADADLRQVAVVGAFGAVAAGSARRSLSVPRPRLDELLVSCAVGMLAIPPGAPTGPAPREPAWQPPPSRRDEILSVALRLFRERGFRGVGIDEIGEAAGITGPTVYHHYRSKAEILVDAFDRAGQRVAVGADDALASASSAADALDRLARSYVGVAVDNVDLMVVTNIENGALPEEERPRLIRRARAWRDGWVGVVRELRPDLTDSEGRLVVRMVLPLMNRAVQAADGPGRWADHIATLAAAYCRGC